MPYNASYAKRSITVSTVTVTLTIVPAQPWMPGDSITLIATVLKDGAAWSGATVMFRMYFDGKSPIIGSKTTGSDGKASIAYTIPWMADGVVIPCKEIGFHAYEYSTGTLSSLVTGYVNYSTRISIFAPTTVAPAQVFTVTGRLEYESSSGVWSPLAGRSVTISYNGNTITSATTDANGDYYVDVSIPVSGVYTLKASFTEGGYGTALAESRVRVGEQLVFPWQAVLILLAIFGAGAGVYAATRKR
jgi:hypothetical protein